MNKLLIVLIIIGGIISEGHIPVSGEIKYEVIGIISDLESPNHIFIGNDWVIASDRLTGCVYVFQKDLTLITQVCPSFQNGTAVSSILQTIRLPNGTFISIMQNRYLITYQEDGMIENTIDLPVFSNGKYLLSAQFIQLGLDSSNPDRPVVLIKLPVGNSSSQITTLSSVLNGENQTEFIELGEGVDYVFLETEITYYYDHPVVPYSKDSLIKFAVLGWVNGSYGVIDTIIPRTTPSPYFFYPDHHLVWIGDGMIMVTGTKRLNFYNSTGDYIETLTEFQGLGRLEEITSLQNDEATDTLFLVANGSIVSFRVISMEKDEAPTSTTPLVESVIANTNIIVLVGLLFLFIIFALVLFSYLIFRLIRKLRKKHKLEVKT